MFVCEAVPCWEPVVVVVVVPVVFARVVRQPVNVVKRPVPVVHVRKTSQSCQSVVVYGKVQVVLVGSVFG